MLCEVTATLRMKKATQEISINHLPDNQGNKWKAVKIADNEDAKMKAEKTVLILTKFLYTSLHVCHLNDTYVCRLFVCSFRCRYL